MAVVPRLSSRRFIGRSSELTELRHAYDRAAAGQSGAVVLGGEAGVGKTRVLAELARMSETSGGAVLRGGCVELGHSGRPYAPLVEALRPISRDADPGRLSSLAGSGRGLRAFLPDLVATPDEP